MIGDCTDEGLVYRGREGFGVGAMMGWRESSSGEVKQVDEGGTSTEGGSTIVGVGGDDGVGVGVLNQGDSSTTVRVSDGTGNDDVNGGDRHSEMEQITSQLAQLSLRERATPEDEEGWPAGDVVLDMWGRRMIIFRWAGWVNGRGGHAVLAAAWQLLK